MDGRLGCPCAARSGIFGSHWFTGNALSICFNRKFVVANESICSGFALGDGLWEVRSGISSGRISRVIFCIWQKRMVLLHGFIKKTQKTPDSDKKLALKRRKEIEKNG